jgi:hypothetical protein
MNQIASIAKALIKGDVLTIMDGFSRFRCSNIPREISRSIEQKFDVEVSRERVDYKTEDGLPGYFFRYRLNHTEYNLPGIEKMKIYILERTNSKKEKETKLEQPALF